MSSNRLFGAVYGTLLIVAQAGLTQSQESNIDTERRLEVSYSANSFSWEPLLDGVSRFDFKIPTAAFKNAQRYGDTNALYYMSEISDDGFRIRSREKFALELSFDPETPYLQLSFPYSSNISLYTKSGLNSAKNSHYIGASYRFPNANGKGLSYTTLSTDLSTLRLEFDRSILSENDTYETFYRIGLTSDSDVSGDFSVGRRWFDFFESQDVLFESTLEKTSSKLFAGLELNYKKVDFSYGFQFQKTQGRPKTEFVVAASILITDKERVKMIVSTTQIPVRNQGVIIRNDILHGFRKSNLPTLWREKFTYSH